MKIPFGLSQLGGLSQAPEWASALNALGEFSGQSLEPEKVISVLLDSLGPTEEADFLAEWLLDEIPWTESRHPLQEALRRSLPVASVGRHYVFG